MPHQMHRLAWMVVLAVATQTSVLAETVPGTNLPFKLYPLPEASIAQARDAQSIAKDVSSLNSLIGRYPPAYQTEAERTATYNKWSSLLMESRALNAASGDTEAALYVLSELYRQGHNMDVIGSAELAMETADRCLEKYPESVACHFSASYFYVSVHPSIGIKAEGSLRFLREYFAPEFNPEVERGWVYFYLHQQRRDEAIQQIDYYLSKTPTGTDHEAFVVIREQLLKGPLKVVTE